MADKYQNEFSDELEQQMRYNFENHRECCAQCYHVNTQTNGINEVNMYSLYDGEQWLLLCNECAVTNAIDNAISAENALALSNLACNKSKPPFPVNFLCCTECYRATFYDESVENWYIETNDKSGSERAYTLIMCTDCSARAYKRARCTTL